MRVVRLDSFAQIHEYGVRWNDLLSISRDNHVFLTLEWLETWWKHFGAKRRLILLTVEDHGKILALAPLMDSTYRFLIARMRVIEFVGSPTSDYQSFILVGESASYTRMILDYIKGLAWDCLELKNIPNDSETAKELKASSRKPLALEEREMDVCTFVSLPRTFDEYFQSLRKKMRHNLRQRERRLRDKHRLEYRSYSQMNLTLEEAMETFFTPHQQRWQSRGYEGKFADPVFKNFHLDVARRFDERGWLRLYFLTLDDEPVATDYCFQYGQKMYSYLSGFNPQYSEYGVGNISALHSIESSIKGGLRECDMLRGVHSYKESWASGTRRTIELSAVRWKPVSKAYEWLVKSNIMPSLSSKLRKHALSHMMARAEQDVRERPSREYRQLGMRASWR